jgi:hypothetical protein
MTKKELAQVRSGRAEAMKVWITKYALTSGIREEEAEEVGNDMVRVRGEVFDSYFHLNEWHKTEELARSHVVLMIRSKLASLRKQEAKLKALKKDLFRSALGSTSTGRQS